MTYEFDSTTASTTIQRFITGKLLQSGMSGYVVGLSGGIDSALACTLAVRAVGPEKVLAVMMPYKTSSEHSLADARRLIDQLGIEHRHIEITPMIDAYYDIIDDSMRIRAGNKMARERMSILFDLAFDMNRLVLGTGNRTEICLGYTTIYGDSACSLNPIGELYKSEVRQLARELGVPDTIITKPPSADLWVDQTDEGEIGVTYEQIDRILRLIIDDGVRSMAELETAGMSTTDISRVVSMINRNAFKRRMPEIAPLGKTPVPERVELDN
ncbi:NAD+ synthase [candidate division GN15 bacterium]|nr:NAD+ synthase [candidate division GN15 bacterium]